MDKQKLHEDLEQLHAQLQQVRSPNNHETELLQTLGEDIQEILSREKSDEKHYQSLLNRLRDGITQFEALHPRVTMLMREVIDELAYLGI